jgi:hypothetical protein
VTHELRAAKAENAQLRQSGGGGSSSSSPWSGSSSSGTSHSSDDDRDTSGPGASRPRRRSPIGNLGLMSRVENGSDSAARRRETESPETPWRATKQFPTAYVPPLDFLPEIFVQEYIDVLRIIDNYAQLYHRCHVGAGATRRDPSLFRDVDAARSTAELQEQKVQQLQGILAAKDQELADMSHKLEQLTKSYTQLKLYGVGSAVDSPGSRGAARKPPHLQQQAAEGSPLPGDGWDSDASLSAEAATSYMKKASKMRHAAAGRTAPKQRLESSGVVMFGRQPAAAPVGAPLLSPFPLVEPWHRIVEN